MVLTRSHGIDKDLWYRKGLMVLTIPMVLTKTKCIESVILNYTCTRGPSATRMPDFLERYSLSIEEQLKTKLNQILKIRMDFLTTGLMC